MHEACLGSESMSYSQASARDAGPPMRQTGPETCSPKRSSAQAK